MGRIHQLPALVINKIAAGEVIERPASVVKELLENSVDAGSRRIDVVVENGGADLIRIVDDGCGMHPDDLPLAFASHATSKLQTADDLFNIGTLGFRGEALASIGGVGQVTLQSRPAELACGAEISCNGGEFSPLKPWNGSPGTRLEVRHLFFNTPVRRKFLRTPATEMGHITEAFTRLALPHSLLPAEEGRPGREAGLHLTLRHNNKLVHDIPASASLRDRITSFFGPEVAAKLFTIRANQGPVTLYGYIANPSCERGTARMQYLFLNGRWIRDRSLGHAVQEAYRGLLMTGRYAVVFLFLEMPAEQVDVNVHPTKAEVRFRDSQALHHLLFTTLRDRLRKENLTPRLQMPSTMQPSAGLGAPGPTPRPAPTPSEPWSLTAPPSPAPMLPFTAPAPTPPSEPAFPLEEDASPTPLQDIGPTSNGPMEVAIPAITSRILQMYDAYLVMETDAGMLVIDQHALHERILFEQLKERVRAGALESQRLLIPEPVTLSAEQAARALEYREALADLGVGIEDFGGGTVLVTSYPALLDRRSPSEILKAVVDHLMNQDRPPTREVLFNNLLSLMACHSAVRAGDRLTTEQMTALVEQRHLAHDTHHCPHGRPTALLFSRQDLDKQFRRI